MVSKLTLLCSLFLASVALAAPSPRIETRLARRRENRQSGPINRVESPGGAVSNVEYSSNWADAVWDEGDGIFTTVTGTFTVPTPSGKSGAASAWIGIDGDNCKNAILQTGVDFTVSNGKVSYDAWYECIKTTITTPPMTAGTTVVENLTTGQTVTKHLTSSSALCEQNAEWIVEDFADRGGSVHFADFSTVSFTGATASGPGGTYTPSGTIIVDIEQGSEVLTCVTTSGSTVTRVTRA